MDVWNVALSVTKWIMNKEELEARVYGDFAKLEDSLSQCPKEAQSQLATILISKLQKNKEDKKGRKLYDCERCGQFKCYSRTALSQHIAASCSSSNYECSLCHKVFRSQISFHVHVRSHSEGPLSCELCGDYSTTDAECLRRHLKQSHVQNGPYFCEICDQEFFGGREVFRNHLKLHTEDKGFPCEMCDKTFINRGRLNSHVAAVHRAKNFQCEVCSSLFGTKFSLQRHAIKHNRESAKTFGCSHCTYETPILSNLTKHVQDVHREFSFRGGKAFKPSRKILTLSSLDSYKERMEKRSQEITRSYLKDFSKRVGRETDARDLRLKGEELDKAVDALLLSDTQG